MAISCAYDADGNVIITDNNGAVRTVPADWPGLFRQDEIDGGGVVGFLAAGGTITPYSAPAPTSDDVDVERERRRMLPISVTVPSGATFQINMDLTSQSNIQGLSTVGLYLNSAAPTQTTPFRDLANITHDLLPSDLIAMGLRVAAYIGLLYQRSWTIKALSPIPADYAADSRWS